MNPDQYFPPQQQPNNNKKKTKTKTTNADSVAYAENQSMFLDSLGGDAAWLGRYARSRRVPAAAAAAVQRPHSGAAAPGREGAPRSGLERNSSRCSLLRHSPSPCPLQRGRPHPLGAGGAKHQGQPPLRGLHGAALPPLALCGSLPFGREGASLPPLAGPGPLRSLLFLIHPFPTP